MENTQIRSQRREKDQRHREKPSTMNGGFGGGGGLRRIPMPPPKTLKDDEEPSLIMFREMHRQDRDRVVSLLQPVSDEFEATGNHQLYKMASVKRGFGYEFLGDTGKNDYDWLKTPPATPLFPSLEMEANAPELVVQREIPIIQPLSRFSGINISSMPAKLSSMMPNSPKPKAPPLSLTKSTDSLNENPPTLLSAKANKKKPAPTNHSDKDTNKNRFSKPINYQLQQQQQQQKELSKGTRSMDSKLRPTSRGRAVSQARSANVPADQTQKSSESANLKTTTIDHKNQQNRSTSALRARYKNHQTVSTIQNQERSNSKPSDHETPQNLKTKIDPQHHQNRSTSALRARYGTHQTVPTIQNQEKKTESSNSIAKATSRRLSSCSPSVNRGRRQVQDTKQEAVGGGATVSKSKMQPINGSQILGSRMVDKFMNARRSATPGGRGEIATMNPKSRGGSVNEGFGFGRKLMSKSLLD